MTFLNDLHEGAIHWMARLESNDRYYDDYIYPNYFMYFDTAAPVDYLQSGILQSYITAPLYIANKERPITECNKIYLGSLNTKRALLENTETGLIPSLVSWNTYPNDIDYYIGERITTPFPIWLSTVLPHGHKASNNATFSIKEVA